VVWRAVKTDDPCEGPTRAHACAHAGDVICGSYLFSGSSSAAAFSSEMWPKMAASALIFALAIPIPRSLRRFLACADDAIMATGRTTTPTRSTTSCCFPYIFRCGAYLSAPRGQREMKIAGLRALKRWRSRALRGRGARPSASMPAAFGPNQIIPDRSSAAIVDLGARRSPMPPNVLGRGVAGRSRDFDAYATAQASFVFK